MKFLLILVLAAAGSIIYTNLLIAKQEEESQKRFIISQEEKQKSMIQESLTANLLHEKEVSETAKTSETSVLEEAKNISQEKKELQGIITDLQGSKEVIEENISEKSSTPALETSIQLIKSLPGGGIQTWQSGKELNFEFNEEINLESFFNHLEISPSLDGSFSGEINYGTSNKQIIIKPIPSLSPETEYTLTLKKGVKALDGKSMSIEDFLLTFTVK